MSQATTGEAIQPIDIKQVFRAKNPSLARWIPEFIYRYLKRIIHQDDINEILKKYGRLRNLAFIDSCIRDFNVKVHVEGKDNISKEGRFIFVANHPLGGFDGIVLLKIITENFKECRCLVNDILMHLTPIKDLFLPINKHGSQAFEAAKEIEDTYASDMQMLTFPSGFVSRKIKGQVMDYPWKKSFIVKAVQHQRDIIPVHFSGTCSKFFYRLFKLRTSLGIKLNIEMLYLVDESFKHRNKSLTIQFGKPIPWQIFDNSKTPTEWAKWVKEQTYALAGITEIPV